MSHKIKLGSTVRIEFEFSIDLPESSTFKLSVLNKKRGKALFLEVESYEVHLIQGNLVEVILTPDQTSLLDFNTFVVILEANNGIDTEEAYCHCESEIDGRSQPTQKLNDIAVLANIYSRVMVAIDQADYTATLIDPTKVLRFLGTSSNVLYLPRNELLNFWDGLSFKVMNRKTVAMEIRPEIIISFDYDSAVNPPFAANNIIVFDNGATARIISQVDTDPTGSIIAYLLTGTIPPIGNNFTWSTKQATVSSAPVPTGGVILDTTGPEYVYTLAAGDSVEVSKVGNVDGTWLVG